MAFGLGFVQGLATSTDEALKTHIKDNKDRFDKNLEAALSRNLERSTRYDKDTKDAQEALELMAGLTGGNLGQAAAAIKGIGGYKQVQGFVDAFRKGQQTNKDLDFSKVVEYTHGNLGELTNQQAINQLVKPLEFTIPKAEADTKQKNWYQRLTSDPRSMAEQVPKILRERGIHPTQVDKMVDLQNAKINWGALRTPEQEFGRRTLKATTEFKEGQVDAQAENLKVLQNTVAQLPRINREAIEKFQLAQEDKRSSMEDREKRLRIFEENNTPEMIKLNRRYTIAKTVKAESGTDAEMQWNLLDTQERNYRQQIREAQTDAGGMPTGRKVQEWRDQIADIKESKEALMGTIAADASTEFSKDSPRLIFKGSLDNAIRSIPGLKYADSVQGVVINLNIGQANSVLDAYQKHATDMQTMFGNKKHAGVQMQLKIAHANARLAERLIFKKIWSQKNTATNKPKNLYMVDKNNAPLLNANGQKVENPNLRPNDRVLINDQRIINLRKKAGFLNPDKGVWAGGLSEIMGNRG